VGDVGNAATTDFVVQGDGVMIPTVSSRGLNFHSGGHHRPADDLRKVVGSWLAITGNAAPAHGEGGTESKTTFQEAATRRLQGGEWLRPAGRAIHGYLLRSNDAGVSSCHVRNLVQQDS
jgi:hypothetical protein